MIGSGSGAPPPREIVLTERSLGSFPRVASWDALFKCCEDSIYLMPDAPLGECPELNDWSSGSRVATKLSGFDSMRSPLSDLPPDQAYCLHLFDAVLTPPVAGTPSQDRMMRSTHPGLNLLYTARNELLSDSYYRYRSLPSQLVQNNAGHWQLPHPGKVDLIEEPSSYVELVSGHFGHALVEGLARVWPFAGQKGVRPDALLFVGFGGHKLNNPRRVLPDWLIEIYRAIGLDPVRQIRRLERPTRFRRLLVPKRISPFLQRPGQEFDVLTRELGRRISSSVRLGAPIGKIFLSRSRLSPGQKKILINDQAERLDTVFRKLGYAIVHPQEMTLSQQVALVRGASHIVGCAGSQLHLTMFCENPPPPLFKISGDNVSNPPTDASIYWAKTGRVDQYIVPQPSKTSPHRRNKDSWQLRPEDFERLAEIIEKWEGDVLKSREVRGQTTIGGRELEPTFVEEEPSTVTNRTASDRASMVKPVENIHYLWSIKRYEEGVLASAQWYEKSGKPLALAWGGRFLQRLSRNSDAIKLLEKAHEADVKAPWLCVVYATALIKEERFEEANEKLSGAIKKPSPKAAGALLDLQQQVFRHLQQWDLAQQAGLRALEWQMKEKPFARASILHKLIRKLGVHNYLEIGVNDGSTFLRLEAPIKLAVDPQFRVPGGFWDCEQERWFPVASDEFFRNQADWLEKNALDLVFVDGLHTYDQSLADVRNSLKYLRPGGVIVMHDCLPTSEAAAAPTMKEARLLRGLKGDGFAGGPWMGDVYRTILHLRSFSPDLEVHVLDSDCGLGIVRPGKPQSLLSLSETQIRHFSYQELVSRKDFLLNLKSPEWFNRFLENLPKLQC